LVTEMKRPPPALMKRPLLLTRPKVPRSPGLANRNGYDQEKEDGTARYRQNLPDWEKMDFDLAQRRPTKAGQIIAQ